MHALSRSIISFTISSIVSVIVNNEMASLSVQMHTKTLSAEDTSQKRRRYLITASLFMNVRQMHVKEVAKRVRELLQRCERRAQAANDAAHTCGTGAAMFGENHNVFLLQRQHETVGHTANNYEDHATAFKHNLVHRVHTTYLSKIANISPVPNSDSLDRKFGWYSSAATTCTRCCKRVHIACLMDGRSPRNLAYMHRASGRQDSGD